MASTPRTSILPLLRQAAPRLSKRFFAGCQQCPRQRLLHTPRNPQSFSPVIRQTPFLKAFRSQSTASSGQNVSSIADLGKTDSTDGAAQKESSFPKVSSKSAAYWLYASAASVFGIVVFGGLTRLTESGLSITEWRPVTGSRPPMNAEDWESEFSKYRASPEFKKLNPNMDLAEFKQIYFMEWTHRLWGRVIGLSTLLPTIYFIARRRVSAQVARNLILINGLIITQGFVGWWMVKSGLKDDLFAPHAHPRVSQYRLAVHLGLAFTVYVSMLWNGMQILRERKLLLDSTATEAVNSLSKLRAPNMRLFRASVGGTAALIFVTAMAGALVAGLDAGLIYNEWPRMGVGYAPPRAELFDAFYSRKDDRSDLWWRNMLENPSLVQLDHRLMAYTTFTAVHALYLYSRFSPVVRAALTRPARGALAHVVGMVWIQASLGIFTLLYLVPTSLAATHQAGSLALLTFAVMLGARVWTPPRLARLVRERAAAATKELERQTHAKTAGMQRANIMEAQAHARLQ